jgi:hypothetical protein
MSDALHSEEVLRGHLMANYSPPAFTKERLGSVVEKLLELYPDDPALGSPFNTGNETFGMPRTFKRAAALRELFLSECGVPFQTEHGIRGGCQLRFSKTGDSASCLQVWCQELGIHLLTKVGQFPTSTRRYVAFENHRP